MTAATTPPSTPVPPDGAGKTVLIVSALDIELAPVAGELELRRDRSASVFTGAACGVAIIAAVLGVGRAKATAAFERLLDAHRPDLVILAGFAGALDGFFKCGYLFVPRQVVHEQGPAISLAGPVPGVVSERSTDASIPTLLSVDRFVGDATERGRLREQYQAQAVDMETYHVAQLAAERRVPLLVVRAISDEVEATIPTWVARLVLESGSTARVRTLLMLLRHPRRLGPLRRMRRGAALASATLAVTIPTKLAAWAAAQPRPRVLPLPPHVVDDRRGLTDPKRPGNNMARPPHHRRIG